MSYKIKDSVDLKELEKFGYMRHIFCKCYVKMVDMQIIHIECANKFIKVYTSFNRRKLKVLKKYIKDLIEAGLVENVEE